MQLLFWMIHLLKSKWRNEVFCFCRIIIFWWEKDVAVTVEIVVCFEKLILRSFHCFKRSWRFRNSNPTITWDIRSIKVSWLSSCIHLFSFIIKQVRRLNHFLMHNISVLVQSFSHHRCRIAFYSNLSSDKTWIANFRLPPIDSL